MRPLIFFIIALLSQHVFADNIDSLVNENVFAVNSNPILSLQKIDINYSQLSYATKDQILNVDQSTSSERLSLASMFKYSRANIDFSFLRSKNDYSDITLRNKDGIENSLKNSFDKDEFAAAATISAYIAQHNFSVSIGGSLSQSPYFQSSQKVQYYYRGQYDSYKAGITFDNQTTDQPDNYFINRNFQTQKSPEQLTTQQIQFFYEQVLSEDFKAQIAVINGQRTDRPNNKGYIFKTGYAINQKFFLRNQLGILFEEATDLKNNRGRYSSQFFDIELNYNYSYKIQTTFGYGLNVENEEQTFAQPDTKIGHDIYTLGGRYRLADYSILTDIALRQSNLGTNEYNLSGGFSWNL